jgi:serine phosphatase RsbU (regulator of sigma subunit)
MNKNKFTVFVPNYALIFLFFIQFTSQAQNFEKGHAFIDNFPKSRYFAHDQNWALIQDTLGTLITANQNALVFYDGYKFNRIPTESVLSLGKDYLGNIYYGSIGDFGQIKVNENGGLYQKSFKDLAPENSLNLNSIWNINSVDNKIFFTSKDKIFIYESGKISTLDSDADGFHKSFVADKHYFVREFGKGISTYRENRLIHIKGSEFFSNTMIDVFFKLEDYYLIGTRDNGFYKAKITISDPEVKCKIEPLNWPDEIFFKENQLYHGIILSDGNFAFTTKKNGVAIVNKKGNIIEKFNTSSGLINDIVWHILEDNNKNIWVATNQGIAMIDYKSPIRFFNENSGIKGLAEDVLVTNESVFISTSIGIYKSPLNTNGYEFKLIEGLDNSLKLIEFVYDKRKKIISATRNGLAIIENNNISIVNEGNIYFNVYQSKKYPDYLVASGKDVLDIYKYENNKFTRIAQHGKFNEFRNIAENEKEGTIWVSGKANSMVEINLLNAKNYFTDHEINQENSLNEENHLFYFNDKLFLAIGTNYYQITRDKDKKILLIKNNEPIRSVKNWNTSIFRTFKEKNNSLWIFHDTPTEVGLITIIKNNGNSTRIDNSTFNRYNNIQKNSMTEDSLFIWIATNNGVLKYKKNNRYTNEYTFKTYFKEIKFKNDSATFPMRNAISITENNIYDFDKNAVSFVFTTVNFNGSEKLMFAYRLLPIEKEFSEWSNENKKDYTYLLEGKYTFEVIAKDVFNNISSKSAYSFEINSPWYRTKMAYAFYISGLFAFVYLLIKFNTRRLRLVNELLEKTVKDRTKELWEEKNKLTLANIEITDSINYAQIIQNSILPNLSEFNNKFNEAFVFFKPRNIVSGDFYWMNFSDSSNNPSIKDEEIIACADCTGHGVPGAFMSMIGSEKLNQAISELDVVSPSSILYFLNHEIKKTLKQDDMNTKSKDGMEIALIFYNKNTRMVRYSGANRPLWIFRKGKSIEEIEIIKPTKAGIGGHTNKDQQFEEHSIQLNKGDSVYIFTDGAPDQFGGEKEKKLTTKGLRNLLFEMQKNPFSEQESKLEQFYLNWMGELEQIDDILIIGFKCL